MNKIGSFLSSLIFFNKKHMLSPSKNEKEVLLIKDNFKISFPWSLHSAHPKKIDLYGENNEYLGSVLDKLNVV